MVRVYQHERERAMAERRAIGRRIGAATLREALRECCGKRLNVAHLPFTDSGTVCVDV